MIKFYYDEYNEIEVKILNILFASCIDLFIKDYEKLKNKKRILNEYIPNYILEEQFGKVEFTIYELKKISNTKKKTKLNSIKKLVFFEILNYIERNYEQKEIINSISKSNLNYYNKNYKKVFKKIHFEEEYFASTLLDVYFDDIDFITVIHFFHKFGLTYKSILFLEQIDIDVSEYLDLIPIEAQIQIRKLVKDINQFEKIFNARTFKSKEQFFNRCFELLDAFETIILKRKGYKLLLSDKNKLRKEEIVQLLFDISLNEMCKKLNIDMSREVNVGMGVVDFKLSFGNLKLLIEMKRASNINLLKCIKFQIPEYMKSANIQDAILLIIGFGEKDKNKVSRIDQNLLTEVGYQHKIALSIKYIHIPDKVISASKLNKNHKNI